MTTYKLTYFGARARAELIRLIFVQADVEFENERLPYYAGTAEWAAKKASKHFPVTLYTNVYFSVSMTVSLTFLV